MKKAFILFLVLSLSLFLVYFFLKKSSVPDFDKLEKTLYDRRIIHPNQNSWKETYTEDVEFDKVNIKLFTVENVAKAKLFTSGILKFEIDINIEDSKKLVQILNDSASYVWNELGTAEFDKKIVFYDNSNKVIGLTQIDFDNQQTYSEPHSRTMKWGNLSGRGQKVLFEILNKYL
ncbi:hypothetical protein ACI6PS_09690 [Flavobacterium sp. PLA-1-15]|uniref:hypothetical protein n=1 Tax=Flavobacterium sp. PLA-1-15 TaxID=3380533 RepID=UPI003B7F9AF1